MKGNSTMTRMLSIASCLLAAAALPTAAQAQQAGDFVLRAGVARTKLVDKGQISVNGVVQPDDGYRTRDAYHGIVSGSYFPVNGFAIDASISTPATTNNVPAGELAGTPNLGDDEFVFATIGARAQPFHGKVSPYVSGGFQLHLTTQERDGLGVNLNVPNANGPYVEGGVEYTMTRRWGLYAAVRKAWYSTEASGLLPTDATFTNFAQVNAHAVLNPLTIQAGVFTRFGPSTAGQDEAFGVDTTRWTVRAGLTSLTLADQIKLSVGGAPFPGADLSTFEHHTPTVQIGYFLTPHIAINATLGIPPTINVFGGGSIGALPRLGRVTYGPTALTLQYHPLRSGRIRPYVGAGLSYMIVFGTKDGAFQDLKVSNDLGLAFEAGSDFMIARNWGLFVDVKKALLRPTSTGMFQGMPVVGKTRLDPWAFSAGAAFHF
jgi:outer membrane protein